MATQNYSGNTGSTTTPIAHTPYVKPPMLYHAGMTSQQFQQALAADPGYQAILRNPANRAPNGQLTPQGWNAANQYAQDAGLGEDGLNGEGRTDVAGAFHGGGSRYSVDGNGNVTESHDSWANPETFGTLLGIGIGGTVAAPYIGSALGVGGTGAGSTGATTAGSVLGPSTAESMAATAAASSAVPASLAAPTAATSSSILGTLGKVAANKGGDMATRAAAGMGAERTADNYADMNAAGQNNRALLDSAVFNRDLPSVQSSQVARGDLMSTMHDAAPTGDPRIDKFGGGGLRPSAFGSSTQQAGDALKRQALKNLLEGGGKITPQLSTPKRAGIGENALAGAGIGLNILDAYNRWGS